MDNIIYFEFNNWFNGRDYPIGEPFETWVPQFYFRNDEWCKENQLCVVESYVDMSVNWCITATKEWVEKNCPKLLEDEDYDITILRYGADGNREIIETYNYKNFLREKDEDGEVYGRFDCPFLEWREENFGSHFYDEEEQRIVD